ncbi:hypothetical protein A2U01_0065303, partial [Trifolium medium]|nr:hypothetical protein [Trifolium medium]
NNHNGGIDNLYQTTIALSATCAQDHPRHKGPATPSRFSKCFLNSYNLDPVDETQPSKACSIASYTLT